MQKQLALIGLLLPVAACMPSRPDAPATDHRPPQPPVVFESKSSQVEVQLWLDEAIKRYPAVYARLKIEGTAELQAFERSTLVDRAEGGMTDLAPFSMGISWEMAGETPRLASFDGEESVYGGGAHGDGHDLSIFWDQTLQREIDPHLIFRPGTDDQLDSLVCDALNAEKRRRDPYLRTIPMTEAEGYYCPKSKEVPFILAPASVGERAAGVIFLMGPYVGGAYAEGVFRIFLPTASLRPLLSDTYRDQFSENARRPEPVF